MWYLMRGWALFCFLLSLQMLSYGAPFTVMNTDDAGSGSFRDEIGQANGAPPTPSIDFDPSTSGGTITLQSDLPTIAQTMLIDNTHSPVTVDGAGSYQILTFAASPITLTVNGLSYKNGSIAVNASNVIDGSLDLQEGTFLEIEGGGIVDAVLSATGAPGNGVVITVTDSGSAITGAIDLGESVRLSVQNGGEVTGSQITAQGDASGQALITVTDAGSTITSTLVLHEDTTLLVKRGGQVTSSMITAQGQPSAAVLITVTDTDSTITSTIALQEDSTLLVENRGQVTGPVTAQGNASGRASIGVLGTGSTIADTIDLQGNAGLTVISGGEVTGPQITAQGDGSFEASITVTGVGATITSPIDLQANSTLSISGGQVSGVVTAGGDLSGVATISIHGTGVLSATPTLNGYSLFILDGTTYSNPVTLGSQCTLDFLSSAQLNESVIVNTGGILYSADGGGSVSSDVTNGGQVQLYDSLTVSGTYTQTGELLIGINAPDPQFHVSGTGVLNAIVVDIDGTIDIASGSTYLANTPYVFLNYDGGPVNLTKAPGSPYHFTIGPYTPATSPYNFSYAITFNMGSTIFGGNPGIMQAYLESIPITSGSDLSDVVNAINGADVSEQELALTMMTPALFGAYDWQELTLQSHIAERVAAQGLCRTACDRFNGFWVEVIKDNLEQKRIQSLQGFHAPAWTILGGYTRQMVPGFSLGAFYGYSESKIHWKRQFGSGEVHQNSGGISANGCTPEWKWDLTLMGAWQNIHSKREIDVPSLGRRDAKGHQHGYSLLGQFDLEKTYHLSENFRISSLFEGDYLFVHRNGMTESGADSLDLVLQQHRANLIETMVGVALEETFEVATVKLIPKVMAGWQLQALLSGSHFTAALVDEGGGFTVSTTNRILNMGVVGIDLTLMTHECVRLGASYEGEFGSGRTDQQFLGHLSWTF